MTDTERERITAICEVAGVAEIDDLSDGFHTFRQLYYQRMMLFATIVKQNKDKAWKSLRHEDGELCFGGGWFIVGIDTPEGSYTYHYEDNYYSLFDCEELKRGKHWDGHTEKDVIRLLSLSKAQLSMKDATKDATSDLISRTETVEHLRRVLEATVPNTDYDYDEGFIDGVKFGISTVSAMPIIQPVVTDTNVGDKISRQAVIDELRRFKPEIIPYEKARIYVEETVKTMYDRVVELPTIQPEPTDEQVEEYCKRRCLHVVTDDFFRIAQPEPQWIPCEDCKRRCKRWENLKTLQE